MMPWVWSWPLSVAAGVVLGAFFFGGLWWTTRLIAVGRLAPHWAFVSFAVRATVVLAGFYALAQTHWSNVIAALGGLIVARLAIVRLLKRYVHVA